MRKIIYAICWTPAFASAVIAQEIEDHNRRAPGNINSNGSAENHNRQTLGYINRDGSVEDASRRTLGYTDNVRREHAAAFFFFYQK
jgi:hypothetical protein